MEETYDKRNSCREREPISQKKRAFVVWEHQFGHRNVLLNAYKVLLDINSTLHYHVPFGDFHGLGKEFHGLTELVPAPKNKSQKKRAKIKVGHVFRDKLLIVGARRSVSVASPV